MFDESAHLLDLEFADPVLLFLLLELLIEVVEPRLAVLYLPLPLPHLKPVFLVLFGYLLLQCQLLSFQLIQILLLSSLHFFVLFLPLIDSFLDLQLLNH